MKTSSMILALLASLSLAGATAGTAHAQEASAPSRGTVQVDGPVAKAVVAGPVAIHAYSAFSGPRCSSSGPSRAATVTAGVRARA